MWGQTLNEMHFRVMQALLVNFRKTTIYLMSPRILPDFREGPSTIWSSSLYDFPWNWAPSVFAEYKFQVTCKKSEKTYFEKSCFQWDEEKQQ